MTLVDSPWKLLVTLSVAALFGLLGMAIGKPKGRGALGFWLCFFLSLIGVVIITVVVLIPSDKDEERKIAKRTEQMRIEQAAAARLAAEQQPKQ